MSFNTWVCLGVFATARKGGGVLGNNTRNLKSKRSYQIQRISMGIKEKEIELETLK
ncbi:hypothetical protein ACQKAB_00660 [Helicobacter pylori]|uniref:hypothetical protein n=1 Tax=Helicobacter pylori TaxID=210 RepID=UPI001F0731CC|nr:hypothetical protein [Helicobacter pylori]